MPTVTQQPIQLSHFISNIASAMATYDRLRWWRGRTGADGTFEAATADAVAPASMLGTALTPHALNGRVFKFRVNGTTEVSVTFTGADPVSTAQAVAEIDSATALVTPVDDGGYLRLTTVATGSGASIEILDGDANSFLGFEEGLGAVGLDLDTPLVSGTHEYFYTDQNSDLEYWYKAELYSSTTAATTGQGVPWPADQAQAVPRSNTIVCFLQISDMSGRAISGRRVIIANTFLPNQVVSGGVRWGVFRHYDKVVTDRNGYAEVRLLRGMSLDLHVEGTSFTRRITIPSTGDSVDLLDPALVSEDEFGIQEPNIDFAIRTS